MNINKLLIVALLLAGGALQAETYYYKKDQNGMLKSVPSDNVGAFCNSRSPSRDYFGCTDMCGYISCPYPLLVGE